MSRKHHIFSHLEDKLVDHHALEKILDNNVKWSQQMTLKEPDFFKKLVQIQHPKFLWIGCSDSRVPANEIVGLKPGQLFVHRNIANLVCPSDINVLSVIQYAVASLQVEDIIVGGHYGCGGIKASFSQKDYGLLETWLSNIRATRAKNHKQLVKLKTQQQKLDFMVELNVEAQVVNLARLPIVQNAWKNGKTLRIHGLVYSLEDGKLRNLHVSLDSLKQIPKEFWLIE